MENVHNSSVISPRFHTQHFTENGKKRVLSFNVLEAICSLQIAYFLKEEGGGQRKSTNIVFALRTLYGTKNGKVGSWVHCYFQRVDITPQME